jgi:diguanylate cyclase (GGDEF)-like protein
MLDRALIVDDSLPLHSLVRSHMQGEGLEFHSAYGGAAALSLAAELRPNLVLLDIDMPDMDGFEVCRRLKANAETTTSTVIFLTADFDTGDKIKGLELGAADYVTKPFKPEELCARVRASLRARKLMDQKAMINGVTGLWNQRYLEDHVAAQLALSQESGQPVACVAVDIDCLRQINQKHGVSFGDEILRTIGNIFLSECRAEDAVCHRRGGEFTLIVSGLNRSGAGRLADRLCAQIQKQLLRHGGKDVGVTCSFGVADNLVSGDSSLIERAEAALIRAKQNGGRCVSIARPSRREIRIDA